MKRCKDLREYIEILRSLGEIQEINQAIDWNLEIGAITRRSYELPAPAPLFNNIINTEKGFRVFGATVGLSHNQNRPLTRIAVSLGLPPESNAATIIDTMAGWQYQKKHIPCKLVDTAPCKQNKMLGDEVDIFRFPTPYLHEDDGGRYFATMGVIVCQSPDKKWTNWSVQRCMLHTEKNKLCINIPGGQKLGKHAGMIHAMWQAINQPMPFALVQGVEPLVVMISSTPLPDFISEGDVLSGFIGEPVDVVRCETIDLEVPASAEIVIEGYIGTETATEGPMGEYGGFITPGGTRIKPLADITGITYRDNAILPVCAAGEPPEENHTCWGTGVAASILGELRQQGFPVTTCFIPFESAMGWVVVTIDSNYQAPDTDPDSTSFVSDIGKAIFSTRAGVNVPRAIVVHDDIDPSNIRDVAWVLATRCHPDIGEIHLYDFLHNPLEIMLHSDEINPPVSPKTVYNCLFQGRSPAASARRSSFKYIYPKELQDKILSNWTSYGYEETRN